MQVHDYPFVRRRFLTNFAVGTGFAIPVATSSARNDAIDSSQVFDMSGNQLWRRIHPDETVLFIGCRRQRKVSGKVERDIFPYRCQGYRALVIPLWVRSPRWYGKLDAPEWETYEEYGEDSVYLVE